MYEREVTEQLEKISKMQQEGRDEADIHKQVIFFNNITAQGEGVQITRTRDLLPDGDLGGVAQYDSRRTRATGAGQAGPCGANRTSAVTRARLECISRALAMPRLT